MVIGDPSYFAESGKVEKKGQVVRCICILSHPVANTNNSGSAQIILPQNQVNREKDIYIALVGHGHNVAPKDKYIAIVSTIVCTDDPHAELAPGLKLLGDIDEKFYAVDDVFEPVAGACSPEKGVFISNSFGSESHFGPESCNILALYEQITGHPLVFKEPAAEE